MVAGAGCKRVRLPLCPCLATQIHEASRVDAEWIATKKDWREAKRRYKQREAGRASSSSDHVRESTNDSGDSGQQGVPQDAPPDYHPDMDEMRCILYTHGGESSQTGHRLTLTSCQVDITLAV